MSKKVHISIGHNSAKIFRHYVCGKNGDQTCDDLLDLLVDDWCESDLECFVEEHFNEPTIDHYIVPLEDNEDCGPVIVIVTDEDGSEIFNDTIDTMWAGAFYGNPHEWICMDGVSDLTKKRIAEFCECYDELEDTSDPEFVQTRLSNDCEPLTDDVEYNYDENTFAVIQGTFDSDDPVCYEGDIELEDDEEFDIDKLEIMSWDNDGNLFSGGCEYCVLPTIKYGNKIYRLHVEDYDYRMAFTSPYVFKDGFFEKYVDEDSDDDW